MLLLFVEKKFNISDSNKIELIIFLCKYFIRRNVTDSPPTRDLTNYFMDIIVEVNKLEQYDYDKIRSIILEKGKPANDILFEDKLKGDLYEENVGATRYILSSIELTESQTKERYTNFYARNKNIFVWTVEHILPQGENIPIEWVEMIANGDKDLANQIRKEYVHKLGNLTLTGYNSNLGNLSLSKKQDRKNNEGKYRTPLESKVIHKYPIPILPDPSGVEYSTANIRFTDALFNLQLPGAAYLYSITDETLDSVGVLD